MNKDLKTLIIIAGVAGEIGTAFAQKTTNYLIDTLGVIRNTSVSINSEKFETIQCLLDDEVHIHDQFREVKIGHYERVIYLHTIGVDKFKPRNYPNVTKMETIDPEVYDTNVNSFKYLFRYLGKRLYHYNKDNESSILFKTAIIAGTADKYTPFVIEDFCEAKFIIREYMRSFVERFPEWFSGLSINVTSTITKSALSVRPFAKTDYWLTPEEVVEKSYADLISIDKGYRELDLIKHSPDFVEGYYEDKDMLYEKWSAETGIISSKLK